MGRLEAMTGPATTLVVPAQTASIGAARDFVRAHLAVDDLDPERLGDIVLVVSELVSNAVEHGTGTDVEVRIGVEDDVVQLAVASPALDLPPIPNAPAAADALRGRGLHIVATLSDAVGIEAASGVVSVICQFGTPPPT